MGAEEFAQILMTNVCRLHGMPGFLESDRDKLLTSRFFEKVSCLVLGKECPLHCILTLIYGDHPRTPANVDVVTPWPAADAFVGRVRDAVSRAHDSLLYAQRHMSHDADQA